MTVYNTQYTQLIWRGTTLRDFASTDIEVLQLNASINTCVGIFGEFFSYPNLTRGWSISSSFLASSDIFKFLDDDNLFYRNGLLLIRDLNIGKTEVYSGCRISSILISPGGAERKVVWYAKTKNER